MTREEILKMDERELYYQFFRWFRPGNDEASWQWHADLMDNEPKEALWLCYQAEEKIKGMGKKEWMRYGVELVCLLIENVNDERTIDNEDVAHAHPRDRAKAILLTIEKEL